MAAAGSRTCNGWNTPSIPSGGTVELFQSDTNTRMNYYAMYENEAPGTYTISGPSAGCSPPLSMSTYVFQNT